MEIRNRKIIYSILLLFAILLGNTATLHSQAGYHKPISQPYADQKLYRLGFFVGLETQNMIINHARDNSQGERWFSEIPSYSPGFNIGIIGDRYLSQHLNLRLAPSLHFGERSFVFKEQGSEREHSTSLKSHYLSVPLHLKFNGGRMQNARPYLLAGAYTNMDISPNRGEALRFRKIDYGLEFGFGCNIYFPLFKLCPELRLSYGLANLIDRNNNDLSDSDMAIYRDAISSVKTRAISLIFNFE